MKTMQKSFTLLPPRQGLCQECAVDHDPEFPHNPGSIYYQVKFSMDNGRVPTWGDAMKHCPPDVREKWIGLLLAEGVEL